jgi:hypothetical protein
MLRIVLAEKIGKEKRPDLEYIDLRIDNKVYYKFKDILEMKPSAEKENNPVKKPENKGKNKG